MEKQNYPASNISREVALKMQLPFEVVHLSEDFSSEVPLYTVQISCLHHSQSLPNNYEANADTYKALIMMAYEKDY